MVGKVVNLFMFFNYTIRSNINSYTRMKENDEHKWVSSHILVVKDATPAHKPLHENTHMPQFVKCSISRPQGILEHIFPSNREENLPEDIDLQSSCQLGNIEILWRRLTMATYRSSSSFQNQAPKLLINKHLVVEMWNKASFHRF